MPAELPAAAPDARFTIRAFTRGDEHDILALFARSFHAPRTLEEWRWKFQANPYGREHISIARDAGNHLVGHYAGYPVPLFDQGRSSIVHQIGDTMTDPAVRHIGRGPTSILGRTALHFYEMFCEGKVAFNYGFNVSNIQRFSLRFLRSARVAPVTYRKRDLEADPLRAPSRAARLAFGYRFALASHADDEWTRLFEHVADRYGTLIRRDATYVRWRYLEAPGNPYVVVTIRRLRRLAGWCVFRVREGRLLWGDCLIEPSSVGSLPHLLRHMAFVYAPTSIEGWFSPHPGWFSRELDRLGMKIFPEPQDLSVMCVPFVMQNAPDRIGKDFYYTYGDSDLF